MRRPARARPVVFGEVLVDVFPDGAEVPGGAPFNVAWHLAAFGLSPLFVSAVGDDPRGRAILARMASWGMDPSGVQVDPGHPTGEVRVTFERGEPRYEIPVGRAYDFIDAGRALAALGRVNAAVVVHGTLAARRAPSARCLRSLLAGTGAPAFVDVNLRPPWDDPAAAAAWLDRARWAKLNRQELRRIVPRREDDETLARRLLQGHCLDEVVVTRGAAGALCVAAGGDAVERAADPPAALRDAVGAGDAFTAVTVAGLLCGWPRALRMERAVRFASALCGLQGAVTSDRAWYAPFLAAWKPGGPGRSKG